MAETTNATPDAAAPSTASTTATPATTIPVPAAAPMLTPSAVQQAWIEAHTKTIKAKIALGIAEANKHKADEEYQAAVAEEKTAQAALDKSLSN